MMLKDSLLIDHLCVQDGASGNKAKEGAKVRIGDTNHRANHHLFIYFDMITNREYKIKNTLVFYKAGWRLFS